MSCPEVAPAGTVAHSVARTWNEGLIGAIRLDFARPTVHARNLFHVSLAMYDAWAAYDGTAQTYLLGKTVGGYTSPFVGVPTPADVRAARDEAITYAAYRVISWRFRNSPRRAITKPRLDSLFAAMGGDTLYVSTDYTNGRPAALGNYIAQQVIAYGLQDGANESGGYANQYYRPVNPPMTPTLPGDTSIVDLNRWQPLTLDFIDQAGNRLPISTPPFLSPEWGRVTPFSLTSAHRTTYTRDGHDYPVYHDPGPPPLMQADGGGESQYYRWTHELVSIWASHLDATDGVMWDISPASLGNNPPLPQTFQEHASFYKLVEGGDQSRGYTLNPKTNLPYTPQIVPRGDYTRVLAEFWADGPTSETPPGHWFSILNYVGDHPQFQKRWAGQGALVDDLEWDVKTYFTLGGAMHDAAITAWSIKGWYDYVRPVSAIRGMSTLGQCTNASLPDYDPHGIDLVPGYIEHVLPGDTLAGPNNEHVGKIKLWTWRAHAAIPDPKTTYAGVGWILAENWWPYQRPTFVTPPFAGYISGHSTYSRTAAEVMERLTGDPYFPGGMSEFRAPRNEYLVFEDGPSMDVVMQWAAYRDASDQCSLSRIWGGIHPPADDIPGRLIGIQLGPEAYNRALQYFSGTATPVARTETAIVFTNPTDAAQGSLLIELGRTTSSVAMELYDVRGRLVRDHTSTLGNNVRFTTLDIRGLDSGVYFLRVAGDGWKTERKVTILN